MKKINRKGFTLIELLATIAIIGLVIGLSTFGIIKIVENSKNKAKDISMDSIKSSARIYSEEASSSDWKDITSENYKYFCVTIQELINKGLLKEKEIKNYIEKDDDKFNYVVVTKNKLTETVEKEEIISSYDLNDLNDPNNQNANIYKICTGSIVNETVTSFPSFKTEEIYTDEIDISFVPAEFSDESIDENGNKVTPEISVNKCYYGTTSSNLTTEGQIKKNSNICIIGSEDGGLENNNTYYVKVCTITKKGSRICSNAKSYTSANFKNPTITINNNVTITYKDDNIKGEAGHYFKSTLDGTSTSEVQKCDNNFNCEESTTSITKDTWYKTNDSSVTLTYQNSGDGRVTARITDRSGNSKETQKYISVYKVTFNKGTTDKIDGTTSDVSKICVAETGKTCTIKSPSITKANYTVIGWNTNSSAKTSSWNVGVEKNISNNSTYYPIVRINKVYIRFNTNGGTVTGETTTAKRNIYKWKTDSNGLISRTNANGSTYSSDFFSIKYGNSTGNNGLPDYNNSKYLEIKKIGYSAVSGSEWKCLSGCTTSDKTFNKKSIYNASDFCNASNGDCTVVLGVNWQANTYTVTYDANGGSGAPSAQTKTYGTDLTLSSTTPTKAGYTFQGWGTTSNATTVVYKPGAKYTSNASITLYAIWKTNTYTITYNANGGSGAPSAQTKTYGTDLILSSTKPTRTDYTFQGWATSSSATSATYQPGSTYTTNANLTLYAVWNSYICSYNNKRYATFEEAKAACTITDIQDMEAVESTTYSCPAGYTCSGGTCTSSSKCEKTVTGEISKMYYCSHNKSYQTSSKCSYTGWENAAFDLGCSTTKTCSDPTYTCPSRSSLSGTKCYKYDRYSCPSGWTAVKTGYCEYSCARGNVLLYAKCSGSGTCKSDSAYSCVSTCGSNDDQHCRANIPLYGSNYPYTSCKTTNTIYNCYTSATKKENCVTTGQYYAGNYRGCRLVGSDKVTNGFSCSSGNTGNYNDVGTSSCAISGYTLTKSLDGDCPDELKFDKDGTKYCDTANDYWKGKSCTSGYQYGASAIYKLTCSKTGTLKYYCDITDTYSTSQPSSCSKKVSEDVISTVVTNYVCPIGYNPSDNDDTCYKTVVYEVQ